MAVCCICGIEYTPKSSGITFHKFPKNMEKKHRWLAIIEKKIRNFSHTATSVICSHHFEKECYVITATDKLILKTDAVPTKFNMPLKSKYIIHDTNEERQLKNAYDCEKSIIPSLPQQHEIPSLPQQYESIISKRRMTKFDQSATVQSTKYNNDKDNNIVQHTKEIERLRKSLKIYQQKCRRYKKKIDSLTSLTKQDKQLLSQNAAEVLQNTVSLTEKEMIERHLKGNKRGAFPSELKTFAATLQFYSTKAYEYVRRTFLNILPHPQTIRKWYSSVEGKPGITTEALRTVEAKVNEAMSEGKQLYFSLTVDDMSIREPR